MAELSNGRSGAARLAVRLALKHRPTPDGWFTRGRVFSFGGQGWLWADFVLLLGERALFEHEIMVQAGTLRSLYDELAQLQGTSTSARVRSGAESPELTIEAERCLIDPHDLFGEDTSPYWSYTVRIHVDPGVALGEIVSGEGPGMFLYALEADLLRFVRDLVREAGRVSGTRSLDA